MAYLYVYLGKYNKAEKLLQKTIPIFKKSEKGLINEKAASSISMLGNLSWYSDGNFEAADSLLTKALKIEKNFIPALTYILQ